MNILFLENHAIFADQVIREFLPGHTVKLVGSILQARDALAHEQFDLILSDYDLDDGKGTEFVQEYRKLRPLLPIIAVSAHEEGNRALLQAGASDVCCKMEFDRIQRVIDRCLHPD